MKCKKCGSGVKEGAKFCGECGQKDPGKIQGLVCTRCGTSLKQNAKFCMECGQPVRRLCKCGAEIQPKSKFCEECGQTVGGTPSSEEHPLLEEPELPPKPEDTTLKDGDCDGEGKVTDSKKNESLEKSNATECGDDEDNKEKPGPTQSWEKQADASGKGIGKRTIEEPCASGKKDDESSEKPDASKTDDERTEKMPGTFGVGNNETTMDKPQASRTQKITTTPEKRDLPRIHSNESVVEPGAFGKNQAETNAEKPGSIPERDETNKEKEASGKDTTAAKKPAASENEENKTMTDKSGAIVTCTQKAGSERLGTSDTDKAESEAGDKKDSKSEKSKSVPHAEEIDKNTSSDSEDEKFYEIIGHDEFDNKTAKRPTSKMIEMKGAKVQTTKGSSPDGGCLHMGTEAAEGGQYSQGLPEKGERKTEKGHVNVYFHLVISKQLKSYHGVSVEIQLSNNSMKDCELYSRRVQNESGILYEGSVYVSAPKEGSMKMTYKYRIDKEVKKDHHKKDKVWEEEQSRQIRFSSTCKDGQCHVYDLLEKPDTSRLRYINPKAWWNLFVDAPYNPVDAVALFLPPIQVLSLHLLQPVGECADDFLTEFETMKTTLKDQCNISSLRQAFEQLIYNLQKTIFKERSTPGRKRRVAASLFMLHLAHMFNLDLSTKILCRIFEGLLIKSDGQDKKCPELDDILFHFKKYRECLIGELIEGIGKLIKDTTDPVWLYALPLLHLFGVDAKPFTPVTPTPHHSTPVWWWGLNTIEKAVDLFKKKTFNSGWPRKAEDVYVKLTPAFSVDDMMMRSFIAAMNLPTALHMFSKRPFPPEIVMGCLYFFLKSAPDTMQHHIADAVGILEKTRTKITDSTQMRPTTYQNAEYWFCNAIICNDLRELVLEKQTKKLAAHVILLQLLIEDRLRACIPQAPPSSEVLKKYDINGILESIAQWAKEEVSSRENTNDLEKCLLESRQLQTQALREATEPIFAGPLLEIICKIDSVESKVATYLRLLENPCTISQNLRNHLEYLLEDALQTGYATGSSQGKYTDACRYLSDNFQRKFEEVAENKQKLLEFIFTWKSLSMLLRASREKSFFEQLPVSVKSSLEQVHGLVTTLMTQLSDASIEVSIINWLKPRAEEFSQIIFAMFGDHKKTRTNAYRVINALNLRAKELEAFQDGVEIIDELLIFCECKGIINTSDARDVRKEFERHKNKTSPRISDLCQNPPDPGTFPSKEYTPLVIVPCVSDQFMSRIPSVRRRLHSQIFCQMLETAAANRDEKPDTHFWEELECVWEETDTQWVAVCESVKHGSMTLDEAESLFHMFENEEDWQTQCREELMKMAEDGNVLWLEERLAQLKFLQTMKTHRDTAFRLIEVKENLGLPGNVDDLKAFLNENMSQQLKKLEPNLLKASDLLQGLEGKNMELLQIFERENCRAFLEWVGKTMGGDGIRDVKVFVDLALNYVGDNPIDMDKVRNFQAVITGYAPLIFQCAGDKYSFLKRCQQVFQSIKDNPELPAKLKSTVDLLSWLDEIHNFHGSVEKNALAQVDSIISRGILRMGRVHPEKKKGADIALADVICLDLPKDEQGHQSEAKTYSYNDLVDLQSRLMLVVGHAEKGRDNVDKFISVMESIGRVAHTYIQLCRDGCLLFHNWAAKFYCDTERPVCCIVEFFLSDEETRQQMKGLRETSTIEDYIGEVATFLETCGGSWLKYVDKKRSDYEELNMYTMDQLVFLQEQLVTLDSENLSPHLLPTLSLLNPSCDKKSIETAVQIVADGGEENEEDDDGDEEDEVKVAVRFIQTLHENGFTKHLAAQALKHVKDPNDIEEGIRWCVDPLRDAEEVIEEEFDDGGVQALVTRQGTIANALKVLEKQGQEDGMTKGCMTEHLQAMWGKFLQTVKFSGVDCLSLYHLGMVLKNLGKEVKDFGNRKLPPHLKSGQPNLLLCPSKEVLNTMTGLYLFTESAPLPQADEVLLCKRDTTFEQLNIFLRRAFTVRSTEQGKIHCLAFADHLDYDVSERAERMLDEYISTTKSEYQFVVICTAENEFNAHMTAALEKYMRQPSVPVGSEKILNYLRLKFSINEEVQPSAACVDPERSTVRVVQSSRAGMGKTLYKKRLDAKLLKSLSIDAATQNCSVTIPLYEKKVDIEHVAANLLLHALPYNVSRPRIVHLDISYEVQEGVDVLLYSLLVLGCITDVHGHVWRRSLSDLYLVEAMPVLEYSESKDKSKFLVHRIFEVLPSIRCWSPAETLQFLQTGVLAGKGPNDVLFDEIEFRSEIFQRPFNCLHDLDGRKVPSLLAQASTTTTDDKKECLNTLMRHCGLTKPSWSELYHFVSFLNKQLLDFQNSLYCSSVYAGDLPGFAAFVLKFLIHMSKDFATRSLVVSEEHVPAFEDPENGDPLELAQFQMRRTWESSPHPYIFFNPDETTMTFLGFTVDPATFNLVDPSSKKVLETSIMTKALFDQLLRYKVPLTDNFDSLERIERLERLYQVMGVPESQTRNGAEPVDPDDTYELTTDNVKKIMAIYMRFRCNIPVIIMGETGCGKTRLVKFLCALQTPKEPDAKTMVLVKVHGGTTSKDIHEKVREAEKRAEHTQQQFPGREVYTVLFFDEANTTEAIGAIKEVMCDGCIDGLPIKLHQNLKMVAACNPYRKHDKNIIERLEKAGLGYHISAGETCDKLGRLPMRQLVYRVRPLPQSMLPLVWDFGQLSEDSEQKYIVQMVRRFGKHGCLEKDLTPERNRRLCEILVKSQKFMREIKDECSFVSLRDAERTLTVVIWFLQQAELLRLMNDKLKKEVDNLTASIVLALGVCYRAGLRSKEKYEQAIAPVFGMNERQELLMQADTFSAILETSQDLLLDNVNLGEKIARNQALKENIFMMVVCVELRIPLFLVGKPGSSKSLAKSIVADAMQGAQAHGPLFKNLKETQMVSFQCSPIATAGGVFSTFRQCAIIQKGKDNNKFVAVAVLDEIGLAEDSPRMPLKALHPLLEEGCELKEVVNGVTKETAVKVAFIGISNWSLDPAKMNRGILVQREVPDEEELVQTARGICSSGEDGVLDLVDSLLAKLAKSYLGIFLRAREEREFFGLRDFYSLVKMIHATASTKKRKLTRSEFRVAIQRNFGGLDTFDPVVIFERDLHIADISLDREGDTDIVCSSLLLAALHEDELGRESRYLLLLTQNFGGLRILTDNLLSGREIVPIFGSSFPKDQEYTQICCNINHIKVCMETGKTVILLNLDNLYESLYDALNQYYSTLAGARYVDLGLGSHRVKCKVDRKFRLIVVAEKETVYNKFPIPLINRLEKHFLTVKNLLTEEQQKLQEELENWMKTVAKFGDGQAKTSIGDVFIGYHSDTTASIILMAWEKHIAQDDEMTEDVRQRIADEGRDMLLWCATPDAIVRTRDASLSEWYFEKQQHKDLADYLQKQLQEAEGSNFLSQITTHSKKLTSHERRAMEEKLQDVSVSMLSLQSFNTEQQYQQQLSQFLKKEKKEKESQEEEKKDRKHKLLLIQCERGDENQQLLQCAQYKLQKVWSDLAQPNHHVVFIVQLPRVTSAAFAGFLGGRWHCAHLDDLRPTLLPVPSVRQMQSGSPAELLSEDGDLVQDNDGSLMESECASRSVNSRIHDDLLRHSLVSCIQDAVARLRDKEDVRERAMHRIVILIKFLEKTDDIRFFTGVRRLLAAVMREQEAQQKSGNQQPKDWLARDAANLDRIRMAGTFRRAWTQTLESYIVPVLAGIVAYLDTNQNLDLLDKSDWRQDFWLRFLNDSKLCQVHFSDLQSMSGNQVEVFACGSTFLAKSTVPGCMPFSWIISGTLDRCLVRPTEESVATDAQDDADDDEFQESVEFSSLAGHMRDVISTEEEQYHCLNQYISDLLETHFAVTGDQHKVLLLCMNSALRQIGVVPKSYFMGQVLIEVRRVLERAQPRLQSVLDMVACCPNVLQEEALQEQNEDMQYEEMTGDVILLRLLVNKLTPQKNQLNKDTGCKEWTELFNKFAPVILRVLSDVSSSLGCNDDIHKRPVLPYGSWCKDHVDKVRSLWTRLAAVKLFMDYMSSLVSDVDKFQIDPKRVNYTLLWTMLGDKSNFKTKASLQSVDNYLKHANTQMVGRYLGDVGKCSHCKTAFAGPPVQLPCCRICNKCYTEMTSAKMQCPECHKLVPEDFDKEKSCVQNRDAVQKLEKYQKQTNGFLMAVVSQLCFTGQEPPETEAVKHIFGYVIQRVEGATVRTQNLTLREDQIDHTPVLRSFILHLLLRHSEEEVNKHIEQFLGDAKDLINEITQGEDNSGLTELSLLVIHCIENQEREKEATDEKRSDQTREDGFKEQCSYVMSVLNNVRDVLESSRLELETLRSLGKLRYALAAFARIMFYHFIVPAEVLQLTSPLKSLCKEVAYICQLSDTNWATKYFIKYLCREFGVSSYSTLLRRSQNIRSLDWIKLEGIDEEVRLPDRYIVIEGNYHHVRYDVMQSLRGDFESLKETLRKATNTQQETVSKLLLALYREVSMAVLGASKNERDVAKKAIDVLVMCPDLPLDMEFARQLLSNQLGETGSPLRLQPGQSLLDQSLVFVLVHMWVALLVGRHAVDDLKLFDALVHQPDQVQGSFLPTMPQDNIDEIFEIMGITSDNAYAPKMWECPNKHRYVIENCGRPNASGVCPECGASIGGKSMHAEHEGNRRVAEIDRTQPGYILGHSQSRNNEGLPDRDMSAAALALTRFLTHAAMFLGASKKTQKSHISKLVTPSIPEDDAPTFFWLHMNKDLLVLQNVLDKSCDDVIILLHKLCHRLTLRQPGQSATLLKSKKERRDWENSFCASYLNPLVQDCDAIVTRGNELIVQDTREGDNELLNIVYEIGEDSSVESLVNIQHTAAPWKYRVRITVDHFFRQFDNTIQNQEGPSDNLPLLRIFRSESHHLRALYFLPEIMSLQRRLMLQFRHCLDRKDVAKTTIREMMDKKANTHLPELLSAFSKAWEIVKSFLSSYVCFTRDRTLIQLPEEYHNCCLNEDSAVGTLLPDTDGPGRCAYLLVHYLLVQHNSFLERYCGIPFVKQRFDEVHEVPVHAVTSRHLVGHSPQSDLLPLVLAHCNYSLHLGRGDSSTQLDYDFEGFELQLRSTLFLSKSRVKRNDNGSMDIETMVYSADMTYSKIFTGIKEKLEQIPLTLRVRRQIIEDFRDSLPDISQSINNLNTALAYILSLGVDSETLICTFMTGTLRMANTIHSQRAQQNCKVKHVQGLWLLLCQQRAGILATHNEEAFDGQGKKIRKELDKQQMDDLNDALRRLQPERVELMLTHIFECIMLKLLQHTDDDSADPDLYSLHWLVCDNLEDRPYSQQPSDKPLDKNQVDLTEQDLDHFPESIMASQAIWCWIRVHQHLLERRRHAQGTGLAH